MKQSKLEIHHDKNLIMRLPTQDELSSGSAPGPKRTSSLILIDLDSSECSGTGRKTRSSKRKAEDSASNEPKRQKKEKEKVKEKSSKNKKQETNQYLQYSPRSLKRIPQMDLLKQRKRRD